MLKDVTTKKMYETKREKAKKTSPPESEYEKECRELFEKHGVTDGMAGFLDAMEVILAQDDIASQDEVNQLIIRKTAKRMGGPRIVL